MSLYSGSGAYYASGRMPYPPGIATALRDELGLDGTGRLLDVGCGPGSLTALLAPLFAGAVGVDAEAGMIAAAPRIPGVEWRQMRAEALPGDLGTFRLVTFAQSFHWMDQELVAARVGPMISPGGAWVHVHATTHRGVAGDDPLPHPRPPWDEAEELVVRHLGTVTKLNERPGEEDVMRAAGFAGPVRIEVPRGEIVERTADEVVASMFSLSWSAPHFFGDRVGAFEADLRDLLRTVAPDGLFSERAREVELVIWRPPA
jgi:SAM-dependent methyltransferase